MTVTVERCYEFRRRRKRRTEYAVLVDRVWPRGISKQSLHYDEWLKDVAPSTELRRWFGHDPGRWAEFKQSYRHELAGHSRALNHLRSIAKRKDLLLLYSARDAEHNQAVVLAEVLRQETAELS